MPSLLAPIRARLRLLVARRSTLLDPGEHLSVLRHRSMEFEELREYVLGDDVADIDWKATARHAAPLLRRYTAMRARELVFAVDAGIDAHGHAAAGDRTRDVALELVGSLGLAAVDAGDRVALALADGHEVVHERDGSTQRHLDHLLGRIARAWDAPGATVDVAALVEAAARRGRRRSLVVVVTGDVLASERLDRALGALRARHDVVWLAVGDVDPTDPELRDRAVVDLQHGVEVPAFLRGARSSRGRARPGGLRDALEAQRAELLALLRRRGVRHARVTSTGAVVPSLVALADGMRRERGRHRP